MKPSRAYTIFIHVAAVLMGVVILGPFLWLFISSISPAKELISVPFHWFPSHPTISRFKDIFLQSANGENVSANFRVSMVNSFIVATGTTFISILVGSLGAYAFARLKFRFRRTMLFGFLSVYMLPPIVLVIPLYLIIANMGLLDTKLGLIITYCSLITPFTLWTMSNYFRTLPADLEEAARVDGCSRLGAFFRIVIPLSKPGLFASALFAFLLAWDEFLFALIFTSTTNSKTIPVAIAEFAGKYSSDYGLVCAGGVLAALPPVILALIFQKNIVGGLTAGSVKG